MQSAIPHRSGHAGPAYDISATTSEAPVDKGMFNGTVSHKGSNFLSVFQLHSHFFLIFALNKPRSMKRILTTLLLLTIFAASACGRTYSAGDVPNVQVADASRYTSNPDGILSDDAVAAIDRACDSLRRKGLAQVAVVVIEDIDGDDVFTFAHELFSRWGVGSGQSDNGLGILLVTGRREIRFVTGDGLEGILPDALCKRIQQSVMVQPLSRGEYDIGMVAGMAAVAKVLEHGEVTVEHGDEGAGVIIFIILLLAILAGAALYDSWRKSRCPSCGRHKLKLSNTYLLQSSSGYDLVDDVFVCRSCGNVTHRRRRINKSGGGGGIFIGGGGFGGGGGSFGGGSFGGGGAGSKF